MSRYQLTLTDEARAETGANSLAIGWDAPLNTFFLQLANTDAPDDEEEMIEWIGGDFSECLDVELILGIASTYSTDAATYRDRLVSDQVDKRRRAKPNFLA